MNFPFAPTPTKLFSLALIGATRRNTEAIRARAHKKPRIETEQKKRTTIHARDRMHLRKKQFFTVPNQCDTDYTCPSYRI